MIKTCHIVFQDPREPFLQSFPATWPESSTWDARELDVSIFYREIYIIYANIHACIHSYENIDMYMYTHMRSPISAASVTKRKLSLCQLEDLYHVEDGSLDSWLHR